MRSLLFSVLFLAGCGGGSGAPNNPYEPPPTPIAPLVLLPAALTVYPGTPATLTIFLECFKRLLPPDNIHPKPVLPCGRRNSKFSKIDSLSASSEFTPKSET